MCLHSGFLRVLNRRRANPIPLMTVLARHSNGSHPLYPDIMPIKMEKVEVKIEPLDFCEIHLDREPDALEAVLEVMIDAPVAVSSSEEEDIPSPTKVVRCSPSPTTTDQGSTSNQTSSISTPKKYIHPFDPSVTEDLSALPVRRIPITVEYNKTASSGLWDPSCIGSWIATSRHHIRDLLPLCRRKWNCSTSFTFRNESCSMDMSLALFGPKYVKDAVLTATALRYFPDKGTQTSQPPASTGHRIVVRTFNVNTAQQANFILNRDDTLAELFAIAAITWQQDCTFSFKGRIWSSSSRFRELDVEMDNSCFLAFSHGPLPPAHRFFHRPGDGRKTSPKRSRPDVIRRYLADPTPDQPNVRKVITVYRSDEKKLPPMKPTLSPKQPKCSSIRGSHSTTPPKKTVLPPKPPKVTSVRSHSPRTTLGPKPTGRDDIFQFARPASSAELQPPPARDPAIRKKPTRKSKPDNHVTAPAQSLPDQYCSIQPTTLTPPKVGKVFPSASFRTTQPSSSSSRPDCNLSTPPKVRKVFTTRAPVQTRIRDAFDSSSGEESSFRTCAPPQSKACPTLRSPPASQDDNPPDDLPASEASEEHMRADPVQKAADLARVLDIWSILGNPAASTSTFDDSALPPAITTMLNRGRIFAKLAPKRGINVATKMARRLVKKKTKRYQGARDDFENAKLKQNMDVVSKMSRKSPKNKRKTSKSARRGSQLRMSVPDSHIWQCALLCGCSAEFLIFFGFSLSFPMDPLFVWLI